LYTLRISQFPGPFDDPLRLFGIAAFIMVLVTAGYSLRRRFMRGLPGKVQGWLWMHTWLGGAALLVALLHENFIRITHDYCRNLSCLTSAYAATSALLALVLLVVSGVIGRLLDIWQARIIARDAASNGVGIVRALEERILELEYTIERLCAGKSEQFKRYCLRAIDDGVRFVPEHEMGGIAEEHADFLRANEALGQRAQLVRSVQRQLAARALMRTWRVIHMTLASLALLVITYHAVMELLTNVFHLVQPV
ncbi:MAG: hypothetical protein J2P36_06525, partial [Ktedonobacteraceae bacterium]|nr:hypothetical protein [Ktedonobacteraceae bacterium]